MDGRFMIFIYENLKNLEILWVKWPLCQMKFLPFEF